MRRLRKKNGFLSLSLGVFSVFYVIIRFLFLFLFFPMILKLQYFPVVLLFMLYKTVLTFESGKEILLILSRGTVYYSVHWSLTLCSYKGAALYSETVLQNGNAIFLFVDRPNTG